MEAMTVSVNSKFKEHGMQVVLKIMKHGKKSGF